MWVLGILLAAALPLGCGSGDGRPDLPGGAANGDGTDDGSDTDSDTGNGSDNGDGTDDDGSGGEARALDVEGSGLGLADGTAVYVALHDGAGTRGGQAETTIDGNAFAVAFDELELESETIRVDVFADDNGGAGAGGAPDQVGLCNDGGADAVWSVAVTGASGPLTAAIDGATAQTPAACDRSFPTAVSFAGDVQPILTANCALSGCHSGSSPTAGMNLSAGNARENLIGVDSGTYGGEIRVRPYDAADSLIVKKVEGQAGVGSRMPLNNPPLEADEIDTLRGWIGAGAWDN